MPEAATPHRCQHGPFGHGSGTHPVVSRPSCVRHDVPSVPLSAVVQTEGSPSQLDVVWACRATLYEAGIFPIPRFTPGLAENDEEPEHALPLAA